MKFEVTVQPNSNIEKAEFKKGKFKVWIKAGPEKGKANSELIKFLKKKIKKETGIVPELKILRGQTGRQKLIEVTGIQKEFQNSETLRKAFA